MIATSTFATSQKPHSTAASVKTAGATHAGEQGEETYFSLSKDIWDNQPSNEELAKTIILVSGLLAMLFSAFGIGLAMVGVS